MVRFRSRKVTVKVPGGRPQQRRERQVLVDDFRHPLLPKWSIEAINLLLDWLQHAINLDRDRGSGSALPLPSQYKIIASHLVSSTDGRNCFPCQQTVITNALCPFLLGDFAWRIDEQRVRDGRAEQRRQSSAAKEAAAAEQKDEDEARRRSWQQQLKQHATALQAQLPEHDRGYVNALQRGFQRAQYSADDEQKLAASLGTQVGRHETGVATEQWFYALLKRRLTTYRPNDARLHGQFDRPEILNLELVRGLRGECDLRVQALSGEWFGVQTKTLSHVDGNSYQFVCTNRWSPSLLIAAADNTYQHFALVWARDTYGERFTVTFGVEAAAAHTARVILKTSDDKEFIDKLILVLPQAVPAPHRRPAGSMMVNNTWQELCSLQFIAARCMSLGIPCVAADRADAAYDLLVNHGHRVQVKASKSGVGFFGLHRQQKDHVRGTSVHRPYRATDFDFLVLVLLPSNNVGDIGTWIIPMEKLRREGLVSYYDENGDVQVGSSDMSVDLRRHSELCEPFKEAWDLLQQHSAAVGGRSIGRDSGELGRV